MLAVVLVDTPRAEFETARLELLTPDEREERLSKLRQMVGRLPESLREAVLMFYFEKMSYARMAEVLGVTEAAVNQRLSRARRSLRMSLGVGAEQTP